MFSCAPKYKINHSDSISKDENFGVLQSSTTTTTSISITSDGFTCDASLMVENETLKREVDELTHALGKACGGEARLLKCLVNQKFSLDKVRSGYTPRKARRPLLLSKLAL
jgi:hypothetical protein